MCRKPLLERLSHITTTVRVQNKDCSLSTNSLKEYNFNKHGGARLFVECTSNVTRVSHVPECTIFVGPDWEFLLVSCAWQLLITRYQSCHGNSGFRLFWKSPNLNSAVGLLASYVKWQHHLGSKQILLFLTICFLMGFMALTAFAFKEDRVLFLLLLRCSVLCVYACTDLQDIDMRSSVPCSRYVHLFFYTHSLKCTYCNYFYRYLLLFCIFKSVFSLEKKSLPNRS